MSKKTPFIDNFIKFIDSSPTSFHAVAELKKKFLAAGFKHLDEKDFWKLEKGKKYFCIREGSIIAFTMPQKEIQKTLVLASHTDSPALKLKPHSEFVKEDMVMMGVEIYGAPLLSSWLNRDLGIAGKVLYTDKKGKMRSDLVVLDEAPLTIPQVAIHLDRKVNDEGLLLNKQEHLNALASLSPIKGEYLLKLLSKSLSIKELLAHDLFLYPLQKPEYVGLEGELLAGWRFDSLASVYAITQAFLEKKKASQNTLEIVAFWDHEEIGSLTASGAESTFFAHAMERITLGANLSREQFLRLLNHSLCLSVDLGHAVHPNYAEKHDPHHKPKLGQGVIIKTNAQKRYATDVNSIERVIECAKKAKVDYQIMASRNDIPAGTTIGPIHAALTGIPTVDMGIGELSMHSIRELLATKDVVSLYRLLAACLN